MDIVTALKAGLTLSKLESIMAIKVFLALPEEAAEEEKFISAFEEAGGLELLEILQDDENQMISFKVTELLDTYWIGSDEQDSTDHY
jgi:hypothetical protein